MSRLTHVVATAAQIDEAREALRNRAVHDFRDCDDSGAQVHQVEPPSDELDEATDSFFSIFTEPRLARRATE